MLTYLDALLAAQTMRDGAEITRLLEHPLARILPADARGEAEWFADSHCDPLAAPLRVMQLRRQMAELLREAPVVADRDEVTEVARAPRHAPAMMSRRASRLVQMELPLSA